MRESVFTLISVSSHLIRALSFFYASHALTVRGVDCLFIHQLGSTPRTRTIYRKRINDTFCLVNELSLTLQHITFFYHIASLIL
jgi:hypothetical protein